MKDVVVFNGLNSLDFKDIRNNVMRIPEVCARLRSAQEIWDQVGEQEFSFQGFLGAEDELFLSSIQLKSLVAAIVQVGLFDRYEKKFGRPEFLVGSIKEESPLRVCAGQVHFEDMVLNSQAVRPSLKNLLPLQHSNEVILSGISLNEFGVLRQLSGAQTSYENLECDKLDLHKVIIELIDKYGAKKFINIGPGHILMNPFRCDLALRDVQVLESIEVDPMLSWFWSELSAHEPTAVAQ